MASKNYDYFSLKGSTMVMRGAERDIQIPSMKSMKNVIISRSDGYPSMRPYVQQATETSTGDLLAGDSLFQDSTNEYINSIYGLFGTDELIYFSNIAARSASGEYKVDKYTTGTITSGSYDSGTGLTTLTGSGSGWLQNVWRGCWIEISGDEKWWPVETVIDDTTIEVTGDASAYTTADYAIFLTYNFNNTGYKLNIQPYHSSLLVSSPKVTAQEDRDICGPFVINQVTETSTTEYEWSTDTHGAGSYTGQLAASDGAGKFAMVTYGNGGKSAKLLYTADNGDTWATYGYDDGWGTTNWPQDATTQITGISFTNGKFYLLADDSGGLTDIYWADDPTGTNSGKQADVTGNAYMVARDLYYDSSATNWILTGASGSTGHGILLDDTNGPGSWSFVNPSSGTSASTDGYRIIEAAANEIVIAGVYGNIFYSVNSGADWSTKQLPSGYAYNVVDVAHNSTTDYFMCITDTGQVYSASATPSATWVKEADVGHSGYRDFWRFSVTIDGDDKFVCSSDVGCQESPDDGTTWNVSKFIEPYSSGRIRWDGTVILGAVYNAYRYSKATSETTTDTWTSDYFEQVSTDYRAATYAILNGYCVLGNTKEWESDHWERYPRQIRWSVPNDISDWSSAGSGTAQLDGVGAILDMRTVNSRIVTFETARIGVISPKGFLDDPWEYENLSVDIRAASNPVVVEDLCYFIASDGLLYSTNGIQVNEVGSSFDATKFVDFVSKQPIWLDYSSKLRSLIAYYQESPYTCYLIGLDTGTVSSWTLPNLTDGDVVPENVIAIQESSDERVIIGYKLDDAGANIQMAFYYDESYLYSWDRPDLGSQWIPWHCELETGMIYLVPEEFKTKLHNIIVHTYSNDTAGASVFCPVGVQVKSEEDDDWHSNGDHWATFTIDGATNNINIVNGAFNNKLGVDSGDTFTTPCIPTQGRYYKDSTLLVSGTHYTLTTTQVVLTTALTAGEVLYCYWENQPQPVVQDDDFFLTNNYIYIVSDVDNDDDYTTAPFTYWPTTESSASAVHIPTAAMPDGDSFISIGVNKLVNGVKLKIFLAGLGTNVNGPAYKVTGITFCHTPAGQKTLE